jgi:predicted nuclease of restriction endonuclease-like (RecB) superfamily
MNLNFEQLIRQIETIHSESQKYAIQQVNFSLTMRNIIIGFQIIEYEQKGSDRALYGENTMKKIAEQLKHIKGISAPQLYRFRAFYLTYPQIFSAVMIKLQSADGLKAGILSALPIKLEKENSTKEGEQYLIEPEILLTRLSFTHFIELLNIDDPLKRLFYEVESIKNNWGARALGRAINTLLYERTGLSRSKKVLLARHNSKETKAIDIVKNPYLLEFIGLEEKHSYSESDLENAIINHLQDFLYELGRGFCFESRQKRITFDNKHYRIDLVFYHRILKCHILIDLKIGQFDHADAGQMNMYLNYYRKNEMTEGDNPPVGIILCAYKNDALVEYTTTGLDNEIFVSKYMVQLPSKEELEAFIEKELMESNLNNDYLLGDE